MIESFTQTSTSLWQRRICKHFNCQTDWRALVFGIVGVFDVGAMDTFDSVTKIMYQLTVITLSVLSDDVFKIHQTVVRKKKWEHTGCPRYIWVWQMQ